MVLLGDEALMGAHFAPFGVVLILTQDRCTVCSECNMDLEIILTHSIELLGDRGHLESHFSNGDGVSVGAR
jgi:hypothetical protein